MISGLIYVGSWDLIISAKMSDLLHSTTMLHTFIEASLVDTLGYDVSGAHWCMLGCNADAKPGFSCANGKHITLCQITPHSLNRNSE